MVSGHNLKIQAVSSSRGEAGAESIPYVGGTLQNHGRLTSCTAPCFSRRLIGTRAPGIVMVRRQLSKASLSSITSKILSVAGLPSEEAAHELTCRAC